VSQGKKFSPRPKYYYSSKSRLIKSTGAAALLRVTLRIALFGRTGKVRAIVVIILRKIQLKYGTGVCGGSGGNRENPVILRLISSR
jgi:hypothetical protein